jgi:hypothetical protein
MPRSYVTLAKHPTDMVRLVCIFAPHVQFQLSMSDHSLPAIHDYLLPMRTQFAVSLGSVSNLMMSSRR